MGWTDVAEGQFKQRTDEESTRRTGGDFADQLKMQAGETGHPKIYKLRVLPPHENMGGDPFVEVDMHFNLGPDGKSATICRAFFGKECRACNFVKKMKEDAEGSDDPREKSTLERRVKDSKRKLRVTANVVDMDHPEKGVQRWSFPPDVKKQLRAAFFDKETREYRNITHPQTGRNVIVEVEKNPGGFWDYTAGASERESLLADMDWLDKIDDLSQTVREPSEADILAALTGKKAEGTTAAAATTTKPPVVEKPAVVSKPMPAPTALKDAPGAADKKAEKKVEKKDPPAPAAAAKPKREPITAESEGAADADPYAGARAKCVEDGFADFAEITPEEADAIKKKPNCFTKEPDPTDSMCQGCRVLLPCLTAKLAAA